MRLTTPKEITMPTFTVTSPDGKRSEVTGPPGSTKAEAVWRAQRDAGIETVQRTFTTPTGKRVTAWVPKGASNAQIIKQYEAHNRRKALDPNVKAVQPRKGFLGGVTDFMGSFNRGLIGSWTDELDGATAAIEHAYDALTTGKPLAIGKTFDRGQAQGAQRHENYSKANPILSAVGRGTGMAGSLLLPEVRMAQGIGMGSKIINGALTAGTYGTIEGAGQGEGIERIGNAITGGAISTAVGGAMAPAAKGLQTAYRKTMPLVAPIFGKKAAARAGETAAHRKVAATIADAGLTPQAVADTVAERQAINVPASVSDVAHPLRSLTKSAATGIGPGQTMVQNALRQKQENMAARMRQHVDETLGSTVNPHLQTEELTERARVAAKPLYDAAYEKPLTLTPELQEFMASPVGSAAMGVGAKQIDNTPKRLRNLGSESPTREGIAWNPELGPNGEYASGPVPVLEAFDGAKQHLDDLEFQNSSPFLPKADGMSGDTRPIRLSRQELLRNLDDQVPEYAAARAAYAGPTLEKHAFEAGLEKAPGSGRGHADDATAQMARMTDSQLDQFRLGDRTRLASELEGSKGSVGRYADASAPIIGNSGKRSLIAAVHGDEAAEKLYPRAEAEREGFLTYKAAFGGSNTARDLAEHDALADPVSLAKAGALLFTGHPIAAGSAALQRLHQLGGKWTGDAKPMELGRILTEENPAAVREAMEAVQSRVDKDSAADERLRRLASQASKQFGLQVIGNSGDERGLYGPTE